MFLDYNKKWLFWLMQNNCCWCLLTSLLNILRPRTFMYRRPQKHLRLHSIWWEDHPHVIFYWLFRVGGVDNDSVHKFNHTSLNKNGNMFALKFKISFIKSLFRRCQENSIRMSLSSITVFWLVRMTVICVCGLQNSWNFFVFFFIHRISLLTNRLNNKM